MRYDAVKEKAFDRLYEDMKRERELVDIMDRNIRPAFERFAFAI